MNRTSPYFDLRYAVQCRPRLSEFCRGWETIAAFNVGAVAHGYARKCNDTNRDIEYRVMERTGRGWKARP